MEMLIKQRKMVILNSDETEFKVKAFNNKGKGYIILKKGNNPQDNQ